MTTIENPLEEAIAKARLDGRRLMMEWSEGQNCIVIVLDGSPEKNIPLLMQLKSIAKEIGFDCLGDWNPQADSLIYRLDPLTDQARNLERLYQEEKR